jgi:hypothetical protein
MAEGRSPIAQLIAQESGEKLPTAVCIVAVYACKSGTAERQLAVKQLWGAKQIPVPYHDPNWGSLDGFSTLGRILASSYLEMEDYLCDESFN